MLFNHVIQYKLERLNVITNTHSRLRVAIKSNKENNSILDLLKSNINFFKVFDILYPNLIMFDIYYITLVKIKNIFKYKLRKE